MDECGVSRTVRPCLVVGLRMVIRTSDKTAVARFSRRGYVEARRGQSYCQIWCTEGWSCDGPAVLGDLDAVVELHALDHLAELPEAA